MQHQRFFFNLGCLGAGTMLVIAAVAFGPDAARGVGLGIGIAGMISSVLFVASGVHRRSLIGARELHFLGHPVDLWSLLGGGVVGVCVWETVQAAVFEPDVGKWLTLANGVLAGMLACTGLIAHETTTERVVHVLEVVERDERRPD